MKEIEVCYVIRAAIKSVTGHWEELSIALGMMEVLIAKTKEYVKESMKNNDASHDYQHIQRVVALAIRIEMGQRTISHNNYDSDLIILASLLHDVGDKKYASNPSEANTMAMDFLLSNGASAELAEKVQLITTHVSYSAEIHNMTKVQEMVERIPELGVVQDADRLDALGAVGIGRTFTFGGARRVGGMDGTIRHFEEKLERLGGMMKTETGSMMAEERTRRLGKFRTWWEEEMGDAYISGPPPYFGGDPHRPREVREEKIV